MNVSIANSNLTGPYLPPAKFIALLAKINETSRLNRRNLSAAITISSQSGYFDYYKN